VTGLTSAMELAPVGGGDSAVSFRIRNEGVEPVELRWVEPFASFALEAEVDGAPARIVGGVYDGGVRHVQDVLAGGEERSIATAVTLGFDPGAAPADPGPQTRWLIAHAPADTLLRASLDVGAGPLSCEATLRP
jgi:hypothetical protein